MKIQTKFGVLAVPAFYEEGKPPPLDAAGIDEGFDYNVGMARAKAFTPPPRGGLPSSFPPGTKIAPPPPSVVPGRLAMKEGLAEETYVRAFLKDFGGDIGKPVHWIDPAGEPLVISDDLFRSRDGKFKATKFGRAQYIRLLSLSLKNPDEIWWAWEQDRAKRWRLKRRYIRSWDLPEGETMLSVFEWGKDGWTGVTSFQTGQKTAAATASYIEKQRTGLLAWRKK